MARPFYREGQVAGSSLSIIKNGRYLTLPDLGLQRRTKSLQEADRIMDLLLTEPEAMRALKMLALDDEDEVVVMGNPSYLDRLIKEQVEVYGEKITKNHNTGGFLLPNGRFLTLKTKGERPDQQLERYLHLRQNCKKTGMYIWTPETWSLEIWTKPTSAQLTTIQKLNNKQLLALEIWKNQQYSYRQYAEWDKAYITRTFKRIYG